MVKLVFGVYLARPVEFPTQLTLLGAHQNKRNTPTRDANVYDPAKLESYRLWNARAQASQLQTVRRWGLTCLLGVVDLDETTKT